jgi:hypothetical protein
MSDRNFTKDHQRRNMARRGSESISGQNLLPGIPAPRKSKADIRVEVDAAMRTAPMIKKTLACLCGHRAVIEVPPSLSPRRFTCTRCGRKTR